jgi:hypothetical protein
MSRRALAFAPLRHHPTLREISFGDSPAPEERAHRPVAKVWAEYDARQAAAKK